MRCGVSASLSSRAFDVPPARPVQRSTSGEDAVALRELPRGTHVRLSYDSDGSVLAAVARASGSDGGSLPLAS